MEQEDSHSLSSPQDIPLPNKRGGERIRQKQLLLRDNQKNDLYQKNIDSSLKNRSSQQGSKTKIQNPILSHSHQQQANIENQAKIFHDHLQEAIILIMMDEQPQLLQSQLIDIRNFQITKVSHKEIMAFMLIQRTNFIIQKLKNSHYKDTLQIYIESMQKVQKKLLEVFKKGIRQFKHIQQYYDYN